MPAPHPKYEEGVPRDCCKVRSCNAEGQEFPGQMAQFPYAHPTDKTKGIVKRKPVFGYDKEHTMSLLEPVFSGLGGNCDYERLDEKTLEAFCKLLDQVDMEAVQYEACEGYVNALLGMCNAITEECTGVSFMDMGIEQQVMDELGRAWMFFVRLIWIRDLEWENLVRCLSDPNAEWSVDEDYYIQDPAPMVKYIVASKLLVPLQVWSVLLQAGWQQVLPDKKHMYV
uniref:Uncharacterized protein n=1 Tax=Alexandrium monilatum TaxID=311494 RepID=A0A6T0TSZ9_9DINO|mmetsp:Transcript_30235/g.95381  ORF Transcript_30235/g.95381 Transcript_30235/m.95381 type:complete len:226 (+) Transcript_30235:55-732(+)